MNRAHMPKAPSPAPSESPAARPARAREIIDRLHAENPTATTELHWGNPLELLAAVILSAQATDVKVNEVTPGLFAEYRTARDWAQADPARLEQQVHSLGFFRNKTKALIGMGRVLEQELGGQVPRTMAELLRLPGVARKTANVVLGYAFGVAEGIVVDTHVTRVAYRLGLTQETKPERIEQDLVALLPRDYWIRTGTLLVLHGRHLCVAGRPWCSRCPVYDLCPRVGVTNPR